MFCVYLTVYKGNKLPPFYIGSSSVAKVQNGYCGSVSSKKFKAVWQLELKNNPHLFKTKPISNYTTRKEALEVERRLQIKLNVVRSSLYINQAVAAPAGFCGMDCKGELSPRFGVKLSKDQCDLMSAARKGIKQGPNPKKACKGKKNGMFGKTRSSEEKIKMTIARKSKSKEQNIISYSRIKSEEEKQKIRNFQKINQKGSGNHRARHWRLTSPAGEIINLHGNLRSWCKENHLPDGSPAFRIDGIIMTTGKWSGWSCLRL